MTDKEWQTTLDDLRAQLEQTDKEDTKARRYFEQLIKDIELHLAAPEDSEGLSQRLKEAVEQFEATHPRLTYRLNQVMMTLSGSGI